MYFSTGRMHGKAPVICRDPLICINDTVTEGEVKKVRQCVSLGLAIFVL